MRGKLIPFPAQDPSGVTYVGPEPDPEWALRLVGRFAVKLHEAGMEDLAEHFAHAFVQRATRLGYVATVRRETTHAPSGSRSRLSLTYRVPSAPAAGLRALFTRLSRRRGRARPHGRGGELA